MTTLVFVPGIMGSELQTPQGDKIWPPSVTGAIFGIDVNDILRNDLIATDLIKQVTIFFPVYKTLIKDIVNCGYDGTDPAKKFISFPYDWRRSNVETANKLADKLDELFNEGEIEDEIILLAHSMGGLISRYLIETPHFKGRAWFPLIKKLITLGTPHLGAAAVKQVTGQTKNTGLSKSDVKLFTNDSRYPSAYQLIPPPQNSQSVTDPLAGNLPNIFDSLDSNVVNSYGLNQTNVQSYLDFWDDIQTGSKDDQVQYLYFVGSSLKTPFRNDWDGNNSFQFLEDKESGDGTVPISSAIDPNIPHAFSQKKHARIFEDRDLRVELYKVLDAPAGRKPFSADESFDVGAPNVIGLSLNKEYYDVGENIEIGISFTTPIENPSIDLQFIRLDPESGERIDFIEPLISLNLTGQTIKDITFELEGDLEGKLTPGIYQIVSTNFPSDDPEIDILIIQGEE